MASVPSLESVQQAVHTLYHNPNPSDKEAASAWLEEFQKSVWAWRISDEILQLNLSQDNLECCYFAAHTMRTKVQLSFHELSPESYPSFRDALIDHISKTNESTNVAIVTQLCLALADLVLQMPLWQRPVLDLIEKFGAKNLVILDILTVLPEEINSRALRLGSNRREQICLDFKASVEHVQAYLKACMTNAGDNPFVQMKVLKCFTSWISINAISIDQMFENIILNAAFSILNNAELNNVLHEAASDCICTVLQTLEENNIVRDGPAELELYSNIINLEKVYFLATATEDDEKCSNYCRIFTEMAEALLDKIFVSTVMTERYVAFKKILELVLVCVGHQDFDIAAITFNLWYRLSEELYQLNNEAKLREFKPYIERLIAALCRHCQMDSDQEGLLEETDDFFDFRTRVFELIRDVVFIVGSSSCFKQMFLSLQSVNTTWDTTEAALFIMQSVAKNILPQENDVVPKIVEAILNLQPDAHVAVKNTSLLLLGELCEWIEKHPQSLEPILNLVLVCLSHPQLATAAAKCLQNICMSCRDLMAKHFNGLLLILRSLDNTCISNTAATGLLQGVVAVLTKLPYQEVQNGMKEVCSIQVRPLIELIEKDIKPDNNTKTDPVVYLDRLAIIFRYINPDVQKGQIHPCLDVITELWPILSRTCEKYQADSRIMEKCCRCLRFAIRCVGKQSVHLLEPLVNQLVRLYQTNQHSSFLYLGSILVDEYAIDINCINLLLNMLQEFIPPSFNLLQQPNGLRNHPDTVDDLFRLCVRFVQKAPLVFLNSPIRDPVLDCALTATSLDHRDANSSVMKFFYDLIHTARTSEGSQDFELRHKKITTILQEKGPDLVNNLIYSSVFCLHTYMLPDVADVLMELLLLDRQTMGAWLQSAVEALPKQNSGGSITATTEQLHGFYNTLMTVENSKTVSHALRDFARLYR